MSIAALLEGDSAAVTRLHAGDESLWRGLLLEHLANAGKKTVAPAPFVRAALHVDDSFRGWSAAAERACDALGTNADPARDFRRWLSEGVDATTTTDSENLLLAFRLDALHQVVDLRRTDALLDDIEAHAAQTIDHGHARLLAGRRWRESGAARAALAHAEEAERIFAELGGEASDWVREARLQRAGALFLLERFDEGLAIVEAEVPGPRGYLVPKRRGTFVTSFATEPRARAVAELVAVTATSIFMLRGAVYVRALGGVAETYSNPEYGETSHGPRLWARFEQWLDTLGNEEPDELERVAEQARERNHERVAETAEAWTPPSQREDRSAVDSRPAWPSSGSITFPYQRVMVLLPHTCERCQAELFVGVTDGTSAESTLDASEKTTLEAARAKRDPFAEPREPDAALALELEALERLGRRELPYVRCPSCGAPSAIGEAAGEARQAEAASRLRFDQPYALEGGRLTTHVRNLWVSDVGLTLSISLERFVEDANEIEVTAAADLDELGEEFAEVLAERCFVNALRSGARFEDVALFRTWLEQQPSVVAVHTKDEDLFVLVRDAMKDALTKTRHRILPSED